ncbi:fungal-specific transcription factor domain-containing protein [Zychaea mexicana]|uniref:fungal-specific transcription factor domain-containing protein n=1 Tax=Zychaea mexicana TaxID=64656 RepID=UPI0022FE47BD|nr:fungal-specific transcription factor domain-containing protein [Zychaea mexicana]KAI9499255.1 fungal-specific transcription factor domain-containing protein [Zychaea mexicana]
MSNHDQHHSTSYGHSPLEPAPQYPIPSASNNNNSNTNNNNNNNNTTTSSSSTTTAPDQSTPSAFWRNPVYPSSSSVPRLRQIQPTSPPNSTKEDLFKRSEATMLPPGYPPPLNRQPTMMERQQQQQQQLQQPQPQYASSSSAAAAAAAAGPGGRRTRITRACDTCRRKKIKCDVDSVFPCSTCRQYDWECTFNDTAKKRGPPKGYIESLETRLKKMEKLLEQMQSGGDSAEDAHGQKRKRSTDEGDSPSTDPSEDQSHQGSLSPAPTTNATASAHDNTNNDVDTADKVMRYHGSSSGYYLMRNMLPSAHGHNTSVVAASQPLDDEGERGTASTENCPAGIKKVDVFDDDIVLVRDSDDATREATEQTEELVPRKVIETLIHCYFDMPNTTLPILNKEEYLDAFEERKTPPPPTLLTYAICSYACFLISSEHPAFAEAGMGCEQVFHALVDRAAQLIRHDYLVPRISTIKALVILCSLPTYSTSSYRNWILAGMAVRMAQDVGLHRTVKTDQMSKEHVEARKRLWYSVYVTDRWCCAVMGRPLAISDSDCDVDLPDMKGPNGEDYDIFVNFVKLSSILGELLRRIYSPKAKAAGYRGAVMEQTLSHFQRMLMDWFEQLPDDCRVIEEDLAAIQKNPDQFAGTKKLDQGGPLTICYHSVTVLLNRPFILLESETAGEGETLYADASRRCMEAAKLVIDIARTIPSASTARFGWNFSVYSVFQATLIHVYNCTSNSPEIAKMSQQYAHISMEECLPAVMRDIPYKPPIIPFIEKLIALLGAESSNKKDTDERRAEFAGANASEQPQPSNASPMSLQQMISADPNVPATANAGPATGDQWGNNAYPSTSTQATWQQLFSSAGAPFTADSSTGLDLQGILFGNQPNDPNFFMQ